VDRRVDAATVATELLVPSIDGGKAATTAARIWLGSVIPEAAMDAATAWTCATEGREFPREFNDHMRFAIVSKYNKMKFEGDFILIVSARVCLDVSHC
jgi:hypothetical protein